MVTPFDNRTSGQGYYDHPEVLVCEPAISVYDFSGVTETLQASSTVKFCNLPPQSLVRITVVVTTGEGSTSTLGFGDGTTATLFLASLNWETTLMGYTSPIQRMAQAAPVLTMTSDANAINAGVLYIVVEVWPEPTAPTQVAQA